LLGKGYRHMQISHLGVQDAPPTARDLRDHSRMFLPEQAATRHLYMQNMSHGSRTTLLDISSHLCSSLSKILLHFPFVLLVNTSPSLLVDPYSHSNNHHSCGVETRCCLLGLFWLQLSPKIVTHTSKHPWLDSTEAELRRFTDRG